MEPATLLEVLSVCFRAAEKSDYGFAKQLYFETMQPLLIDLGAWNEQRLTVRFKRAFKPDLGRIITLDGADVGWLQVSESNTEITLNQIHIIAELRSRGIGSRLIRELLADAESKRKPVVLSVVRTNPALALYRRLGFRIVRQDREKLHMRWDAPTGTTTSEAGRRPRLARRANHAS
jgi:GNAT superfamily N-acetyltransferase